MVEKILIPARKVTCLKNSYFTGAIIIVLFIAGMGKQAMDPLSEIRTAFVEKVANIRDTQYVKVADFNNFPGTVYFHVHQWSGEVFNKSSGPFDSERAIDYAFYPAKDESEFDLVYRKYNVEKIEIKIVESSLFMFVLITGISGVTNDSDILKQAALLGEQFFQLNDPIEFKWLPDNRVFSTAPDKAYAQIRSWQNRIDGFKKGNGIEFLIYKEHVSIPPQDDGSHWIPNEFKKEALNKGKQNNSHQ